MVLMHKKLTVFGGNGATNSATAIILFDDYSARKVGPISWVKRKIQGRPTDLSHTAILSRIRKIAGETKLQLWHSLLRQLWV